jgi:hypothetical protein
MLRVRGGGMIFLRTMEIDILILAEEDFPIVMVNRTTPW